MGVIILGATYQVMGGMDAFYPAAKTGNLKDQAKIAEKQLEHQAKADEFMRASAFCTKPHTITLVGCGDTIKDIKGSVTDVSESVHLSPDGTWYILSKETEESWSVVQAALRNHSVVGFEAARTVRRLWFAMRRAGKLVPYPIRTAIDLDKLITFGDTTCWEANPSLFLHELGIDAAKLAECNPAEMAKALSLYTGEGECQASS